MYYSKRHFTWATLVLILTPLDSLATPPGYHSCTFTELMRLESQMNGVLSSARPEDGADENFTLLLRAGSRSYSYSRNDIKPLSQKMLPETSIASASTAKMVTVAVIMDLIQNPSLQVAVKPGQPKLTLNSYIKDFLPTRAWLPLDQQPVGSSHVFNSIAVRHLLSFTSGLEVEDKCIGSASGSFDDCVRTIFQKNLTRANSKTKRSFFYNGSHLLVAARLATVVTGKSWFQLFEEFKTRYNVFKTKSPDSLETLLYGAQYLFSKEGQIPNPAGAMRFVISDYNVFLSKFYANQIGALGGDLRRGEQLKNAMLGNKLIRSEQEQPISADGKFLGTTWDSTNPITYSPARDTFQNGVLTLSPEGEDWRYGFGNWLECSAQPYRGETFSNACFTGIHSSPGSFGAYGFIDENRINSISYPITGFLGREGRPGTFNPYLYRQIRNLASQWASKLCRN